MPKLHMLAVNLALLAAWLGHWGLNSWPEGS